MLPILLSTIDNYEDQLVFEEIYTKYKAASMRRALKMLNGKQFDAEDAFQKAWIQISQNLHKLKSHDEAAISTYIMKTIEFKVIDVVNENNEYRKYLEPAEVNPKEYISDDRNLINTSFKKTIAACLAIIIFSGAIMGCNKIREPIVEFFMGVYEKFTEFFFGMEDKETASKVIEEVHMPTYVPEGYKLEEPTILTNNNHEAKTIWSNASGTKIILFQSSFGATTLIDTENATTIIINDDIKVSIVTKGNELYVFWNTGKYAYSLIVCDISQDEIIKIIKSIK